MDLLEGTLAAPFQVLFQNTGQVIIDNPAFLLQTKVSSSILVILTVVVNSHQYLGDPILCKTRGKGNRMNPAMLDAYCWVSGTYTLTHIHQTQAFPGVGPSHQKSFLAETHPGIATWAHSTGEKVYHTYYQWISFVVLLQAALFYAPRFLWKIGESGRMKVAVEGMDKVEMDQEKLNKRSQRLIRHYFRYNDKQWYMIRFFFCEFLSIVLLIIQWFIVDKLLEGRFVSYGHQYIQFLLSDQGAHGAYSLQHPLHTVFPLVTKCDFSKYSKGGDIIEGDIICTLALNVINEKVFLGMWVWFVFLSIVAFSNLVYRWLTYSCPHVRETLFDLGFMVAAKPDRELLTKICGNLGYGDWFHLRLIYKNVDANTFSTFIGHLATSQRSDEIENGKGKLKLKEHGPGPASGLEMEKNVCSEKQLILPQH